MRLHDNRSIKILIWRFISLIACKYVFPITTYWILNIVSAIIIKVKIEQVTKILPFLQSVYALSNWIFIDGFDDIAIYLKVLNIIIWNFVLGLQHLRITSQSPSLPFQQTQIFSFLALLELSKHILIRREWNHVVPFQGLHRPRIKTLCEIIQATYR